MRIPAHPIEELFLGLVVCNSFATIVSLFLPINVYTLISFLIFGLTVAFYFRNEIKFFRFFGNDRISSILILGFVGINLMVTLGPPLNYDSGLYHIQAIKWINEFPAVPGLANLHGRFGFNPNIFTFFALTSFSEVFNQEIFSINFAVFIVIGVYFINIIKSIFNEEGFSNNFLLQFAMFVLILLLPNLASPSPDFLSTVVPLFIFSRIIELSNEKQEIKLKSFIPILILSIYILTVKLAAIPILLLFVFVGFIYSSELKKQLWLIPVLSFIVFPWIARTVISTGWLVFPFPSLDLFAFDWEVPVEHVITEKETVTGFARLQNENYMIAAHQLFSEWFPEWWKRLSIFNQLFFVASLVFPLFIFIGNVIRIIKIDFLKITVIVTAFLGVLFWFYLAPDWRFGEAFILVAALSPLLIKRKILTQYFRKPIFFNLLIFGLLGAFLVGKSNKIKENFHPIINGNGIITPTTIEIPAGTTFSSFKIRNVEIKYPTQDPRCYDCEIPCTNLPYSTLMLRGNSLRDGFKRKGE